MTRFHIDKNWYFRQESTINDIAKEYLPVGQFPTVQWMDLLHHKLIPDPYIDTNEIEDFWVNDADWTYKTSFDVADPGTKAVDLVFEGLDTVVDVFLNGEHILFSKDMFLSHRLNIKNKLSDCNELVLKFKAANKFAEQERCKQGWKPTEGDDTTMGGHSRLWLRKAQYSWGWDWGPCCTSSGPWKPIYLEFYETRIEDAHIVGQVDKNLNANIMVSGSVIGNTSARSCPNVEVIIKDPSGNLIYNKKVTVSSSGQFESSFDIVDPKLWFPFTYGSQPLYEISIQAQESNSEKLKKNIGLRRLELNQDSLEMEQGNSFTFVINNIPVFCGGSNWIPDEFFLPKTTEKRYRDWLNLMKQGNQNMVRVWGGGIIEQDQFYNICDELGILVWQDFLFACGNYPAYDEFTSLVKLEASQQVKRIRHHPSLVILAGNNEDYMLAELFGWEYDPNDRKLENWLKSNFPARRIYEIILPEIVSTLAPYIPYWKSSPYGGRDTVSDTTVGDTHLWTVWHGPMHPYQMYKELGSRFVSEFGFESPPDIRTIKYMITDPEQRQSQSLTFDAHDKGPGYMRRFTMYMGENFRFRMDPLEDYVYCAQLLQSEAIAFAYNAWRRGFKGKRHELCSGVLVWQLNDNWPGTSWALVDYFLRPKPAYYTVKRALRPYTVGMERIITKKQPVTVRSYIDERRTIEVWATSSSLKTEEEASIIFKGYNIQTGRVMTLPVDSITFKLLPNQTTEITSFKIPQDMSTVIAAYLISSKGEEVARYISWPEPLKYAKFSKDPKIEIEVFDDNVRVSASTPVKALILAVDGADGENAVWDDNCIDLVPEEEITIRVKGLNGRKINTRWLYDWESDVAPKHSNYLRE